MSIDISTINRALISLSNGDRSISIPEHRGTYMQQLSSALLKFKESLIENEYHQHELEKAMIEVTNSNERYYNLLDTMATAVIAIDYKQQIVLFNKAAERVFGYQSNEIIGHSINKLIPRMHHKSHEKLVEDFVGSKEQILNAMARSPVSALRKNGEVFKIEASINKLNLASGKLVTVSINDISARLKAEEKIVHQAHYDALTDLPNRFLALDRLRSKIKDVERDGQQGALLFLDLDDFKKVNDSLGHDTGDKILVEAAKRLKSAIRATDTVGRLGGDEFLVVLSGLQGVSDVQTIVDNIIQLFRRSFQIEGRELILTVSVGITLFPTDADTPEDLLRNADSAMYNAKALGRNTFSYYTAAMNKEVSRRLELEEQMHGALERKEFYVLYQPQYSIQSREIVGVEALLRWNNPSLGEVSPAEFIPIAEHTGQISFLGNYVLDEALNNAGAWLEFYDNFCIAINLSPCQFRDPNLLKDITNTIQEAGIPPKALELEITEGVLLSGYSHVRDAMFALNELGVGLAMDDFGTGYSSLSYLRKYPFDTLKVDRSFIQDITVDPADWQLVRTTIAMAHGLGLKVIAEGVETEEQLTKLSSKNCDIAQGYYFSKPTSAEEITRILSQS